MIHLDDWYADNMGSDEGAILLHACEGQPAPLHCVKSEEENYRCVNCGETPPLHILDAFLLAGVREFLTTEYLNQLTDRCRG